jgi:hypothetical protein
VRTRIIGVAVLASALAICLFGLPLGVAVLEYTLQQERGHLARIASDVAIDVADDVDEEHDNNPDDLQEAFHDDEDIVATVYGEDGERLAGPASREDGRVLDRALDGDVNAAVLVRPPEASSWGRLP